MNRSSSLLAHAGAARLYLSSARCSPARHLPRYFSASSSALNSITENSSKPVEDSQDDDIQFPNLMQPDILYDSVNSRIYRGPRSKLHGTVNVRNDPSYMAVDKELNDMIKDGGNTEMNEEKDASIMVRDRRRVAVHKYPLVKRRITQQTGKGKKHRMYQLVVVGNGDGLVGYGEGKHEEMSEAHNKAYIEAVRNMDAVDRFEHRTIWTDMSIKFGSTRILMRPRPVGFGLHCNPNIHQVLKAAGIKDVSAKVWGSRNPINVIKATCMMIQAGNAPLSMGNGIGGKGRRLDAGSGMRNKESVERDRGRKLVDGRTW
ncbi:ribosomal S5 domain 2 [Pyrrhoderma noxium]|uniref:Small ribosomal subunit protein uS5m n=1 Tax=Pyrrhoderma noxium TaxID=2282107 RepID=A0A286U7B5_9AGAM|nr:ribosomal S5 domain 2 [Pyrrhoderma noxium]